MAMQSVKNKAILFNGFQSLIRSLRSSVAACYSEFQKDKSINIVVVSKTESNTKWPNFKLGPIDTLNSVFPLPGAGTTSRTSTRKKSLCNIVSAIQTLPPSREDHYFYTLAETYKTTEGEDSSRDLVPNTPQELECVIHTCPSHVKQDLAPLFPNKRLALLQLNAIVLSHKTSASVKQWEAVAAEREDLAEKFITSAIEVCATLKELGYWADFIDPFSGKPYLGAHTDASLTETDERMTDLGFTIDDVGCCKVIRHHRWNHNVFAGIIFTDAPKDHPVLIYLENSLE